MSLFYSWADELKQIKVCSITGHEGSRHCERPPISAIKTKLKLKRKQKNKVIRKKFYIIKLQQPAIKAQFSLKLRNKYDILQEQMTKKLRNNGKTLRMHIKKQFKKYWGTKINGKNHGSARSRGS